MNTTIVLDPESAAGPDGGQRWSSASYLTLVCVLEDSGEIGSDG